MASEGVDSQAESTNERNLALLGPDDVVGMSFAGCEEAYEFYNSYARALGFNTRSQDMRKRKSDDTISMKEWSCSKQGQRRKDDLNEINRKREPREHTRCGCLARMRILYDDSSLAYRVTKFVVEHNHDLMPQRLVHYLPSHRKISDGDRAQILSMHEAGVKPRQIMEYMTNQAGGRANLGYGIKQLYNMLRSHSMQEITDGDHKLSQALLDTKRRHDSLLIICNKICHFASQSEESYNYAREALTKVLNDLMKYKRDCKSTPIPIKRGTIGATPTPRGRNVATVRKCTICKNPGHTKKSCPTKLINHAEYWTSKSMFE